MIEIGNIGQKLEELAKEVKRQEVNLLKKTQSDIAKSSELSDEQKSKLMEALKLAQKGKLNVEEFKKEWE